MKFSRFSPFAQGVLSVAITALLIGTSHAQLADAQVIGEWKLDTFADQMVPNSVSGGAPLNVPAEADKAPTLVDEGGVKALRFENGQHLIGSWKDLPLEEGKPFSVKVTFTPEDQPSGYYGGLFEACGYGHTGFRLMLNKSLKISVEIFLGDRDEDHTGIESMATAELGTACTVEVTFDGSQVTLQVNDAFDSTKEMAMPAPYTGGIFTVGRAAGPDYNFNGIISEIKVSTVK